MTRVYMWITMWIWWIFREHDTKNDRWMQVIHIGRCMEKKKIVLDWSMKNAKRRKNYVG